MTTQDVAPWYRFGSPDESTLLHRGAARAQWGDRSVQGDAKVSWRWRRKPAAEASFVGSLDPPGYIDPLLGGPEMAFEGAPVRQSAAADVELAASPDDVRVDEMEPQEAEIGSFTDVTAVEIVGVNMHALGRGSRTVLEAGGWSLVIVEHPDDATAHLRANGGYGATHLIRIARNDGSVFTLDEYEEVSGVLWHFLGFVGSRLPGLALPVAFDAAGQAVWTDWRCTTVDVWADPFGWFDHHKLGPELPALFVAWWDRSQDELWGRVLPRVTRTLLAANRSDPLDDAVTTAWTLLETLAWAVLVEDRAWMVRKDFDKVPASGEVRLLLVVRRPDRSAYATAEVGQVRRR